MSFNNILDGYYKKPLFWDLIFVLLVIIVLVGFQSYDMINLTFDENSNDVSTIGLTVSGFILTLLTILLTLKSNSILSREKKSSNAFEIFLASDLYKKAISILKNGVITLLIISFLTLAIGTIAKNLYQWIGLYINIICLLFILLTFLRCFFVLNLIMDIQNNKLEE